MAAAKTIVNPSYNIERIMVRSRAAYVNSLLTRSQFIHPEIHRKV